MAIKHVGQLATCGDVEAAQCAKSFAAASPNLLWRMFSTDAWRNQFVCEKLS